MDNNERAPNAFVHSLALAESPIGKGSRVWAWAHIMEGAQVGSGCNIGEHCFIEKGASVGDGCTIKNGVQLWDGVVLEHHVFVGPNATFTNDRYARPREYAEVSGTRIHHHARIGANATVLCGITIGAYATIGAGAVVTKNVPPHALMVGIPARQVGWVCICGRPIKFDGHQGRCERCGAKFRKRRTLQ